MSIPFLIVYIRPPGIENSKITTEVPKCIANIVFGKDIEYILNQARKTS
jgi:hypothetical protein